MVFKFFVWFRGFRCFKKQSRDSNFFKNVKETRKKKDSALGRIWTQVLWDKRLVLYQWAIRIVIIFSSISYIINLWRPKQGQKAKNHVKTLIHRDMMSEYFFQAITNNSDNSVAWSENQVFLAIFYLSKCCWRVAY